MTAHRPDSPGPQLGDARYWAVAFVSALVIWAGCSSPLPADMDTGYAPAQDTGCEDRDSLR